MLANITEHVTSPVVWFTYHYYSIEENWFFLPQQVLIAINLSLKVGLCVHFLFLVLGFSSCLNLCKSCACCHSLFEFICSPALLCLENAVLLESFTISCSYNHPASSSHRSLSLKVRTVIWTFNSGLSALMPPTLCTLFKSRPLLVTVSVRKLL